MMEAEAAEDDRPVLEPGEVVRSPCGTLCYRVEDLVGEGRCCLVYSAHQVGVGGGAGRAAIKCYRRGAAYDGAVRREAYVLAALGKEPPNNIGEDGKGGKKICCFYYYTGTT